MKSFSSSAINKSGKKFAPKAPVRRAAPAPAAAPRRPSVASQVSASQTPQPQTQTATPEPASTAEPSPPLEIPAPDAATTHEKDVVPTTSATATATAIATPKAAATAISIPRPKRKPSFSAFTLSQPPNTTPIEPTPLPSIEVAPDESREDRAAGGEPRVSETRVNGESSLVAETPAEIRPSKRPKTTAEPATPALESQRPTGPPQLATPPATQTSTNEETTESRDTTESQPPAEQNRKPSKSRKRKPSKDVNGGDTTTKMRERKPRAPRKKREPTPEGSEAVQIAPGIVKMSELCKDLRTGKISKRETELRQMELAELERKQKAQQDAESTEQTPIKESESAAPPVLEASDSGEQKSQNGPVMRIVNGEIVLDAASLQVDRHADAARNAGELEDVVENSFTRKVNQASFGKRSKTESWDEEMTDLFYRGLRMFGTDFMMISKLFPGRSRRQIKLKFNNEERRDPGRIKDTLLGPREAVDITTYSEMTNTIYDDPRIIQQELDEEKKRIEDQHAKEKQAQEELINNPDGAADANHFPEQDQGTAPVKSKRNSRKQAAKNTSGGNEEILGTIDDFP